MKIQRIALVGGSGFVGRHLARRLRNLGYQCRIITRHAYRHRALRTVAEVVEAVFASATAGQWTQVTQV